MPSSRAVAAKRALVCGGSAKERTQGGRRGERACAVKAEKSAGGAQARARGAMPVSRPVAAKRPLIAALKSLARAHGVAHSARGSAKERTQGGRRGERACAVKAEKSALPLQ